MPSKADFAKVTQDAQDIKQGAQDAAIFGASMTPFGGGASLTLSIARLSVNTERAMWFGYFGVDAAGVVRYVGITSRSVTIRQGEHWAATGTGKELLGYGSKAQFSTKIEARTWEQSKIILYGMQKNGGQLLNKANSIAEKYWTKYGL